MPNYRIPDIVKHCCIAIYREGKISAKTNKDRFRQCLMIARSRLAQYGFIVLAGENLSDPIGLTPKGRTAEQKHKREGRAKSVLFDTLYEQFDIDGKKAEFEAQRQAEAKKKQEAAAEKKANKPQKTPAKRPTRGKR